MNWGVEALRYEIRDIQVSQLLPRSNAFRVDPGTKRTANALDSAGCSRKCTCVWSRYGEGRWCDRGWYRTEGVPRTVCGLRCVFSRTNAYYGEGISRTPERFFFSFVQVPVLTCGYHVPRPRRKLKKPWTSRYDYCFFCWCVFLHFFFRSYACSVRY